MEPTWLDSLTPLMDGELGAPLWRDVQRLYRLVHLLADAGNIPADQLHHFIKVAGEYEKK